MDVAGRDRHGTLVRVRPPQRVIVKKSIGQGKKHLQEYIVLVQRLRLLATAVSNNCLVLVYAIFWSYNITLNRNLML